MESLRSERIISLWEQGRERTPIDRSLLFLGAALPALDEPAQANLSLAERDRALIAFRSRSFGHTVQAQTRCPNCSEELEFEFDGEQVPLTPIRPEFVIQNGIRFRLPSSVDLAAVAQTPEPDRACRELARRCCLDDGVELSDAAIEEADSRMAEIHATGLIFLRLNCASCCHIWDDRFEIAPFLWIEIEQLTVDLLDQVHWLASRYGWPEAAILAMSAARRANYLERCCT